ncbi:MAG: YceI family protein [Bacteroidota bacterium]
MKTIFEMESADVTVKSKWGIDASHSEVGFKVKHLMITNVHGVFREFDASIYTTAEDFMTVEIDFWLNPASIETGDARRDEHIKGADFFDIEKYKQITFIGNTYEKTGKEGTFKLFGDLTMKGISKQIKLDVEFGGVMTDPWGNQKAGFTINGKLNRKDWGLEWNTALESGSVMVGEEISINCEIQLIKQEAK